MIGIFKTNIGSLEERQQMIQAIASSFPVGSCHVDLDDCDKVLRIADLQVEENIIIEFVKKQGFECAALE
jgi:glycyl-tRNA synthetase beta subunit